ncbi:MAG: HEAT repeat domain-containing protein [Planctomycetia bacterium]|nr:HEAT repeat domain-containing protein [Planctomycetia bacterium]
MYTNQTSKRFVVFLAALIVMPALSAWADGPDASPEKEKELLAVLRSDAPAAEKAMTCKLLAIQGSSAAVPDLAKLLPDAQLSSWARIALEAIPGEAADEALLTASSSLEGALLVGTINSIGVRRNAKAADSLAARLQDKDTDVASAAAVALGRIGNAEATRSLRAALTVAPVKVRSAVAEGCVLCAERLHAEGKSAEAAAIYDEVRKAEVPKQRIIEATRGAILARNQDGIPLLLEQFQSSDRAFFQLALGTAREFPGGEVDKALATELVRATPERAALIIQAMADRPETVVLAAVLQAAGQGPKQVRLSAINALGRVGDASCLSTLLAAALEADADLPPAAKTRC